MLSIPHLIVIFIVALIIFGPEKIPELARNLGKVMAEFRRATGDLRNTFETHLRDLEREADQHRIAAAATRVAAPAPSEPLAVTPAPGTVPAGAPYASELGAGGGSFDEAESPGRAPREAAGPEPAPPDPAAVNPDLQEPVLFGMALDPDVGRPPQSAPASEPLPDSAGEPGPKRVSDGGVRPA